MRKRPLSTQSTTQRPPRSGKPMNRGFTLVELLVAMGIFTVLGVSATAFLVMAVNTWRQAESMRDVAERADLVFLALRQDIQCLYTDGERLPGKALFFSDYDAHGKQRLFFTRTVLPSGGDPRIAGSGRSMLADDVIDGVADLPALRRGRLMPPGDVMSVGYWLSPGEELQRAARTPGLDYGQFRKAGWEKGGDLIAEGVMHIEYNFWSEKTAAWVPDPSRMGPSYFWDSTRGLDKEPFAAGEEKLRLVFPGTGRPVDPGDDMYPRLVEVKVVIGFPNERPYTFLTSKLSPSDTTVFADRLNNYPSDKGRRFVKIDDEWMSYEAIDSHGQVLVKVKRGRRGTQKAAHDAGALLRYGLQYRMVLRPPCQMGGWEKPR